MIEFSLLKLQKSNRMLRLGFGKFDDLWFIRLDVWWYGLRLAQTKSE